MEEEQEQPIVVEQPAVAPDDVNPFQILGENDEYDDEPEPEEKDMAEGDAAKTNKGNEALGQQIDELVDDLANSSDGASRVNSAGSEEEEDPAIETLQ